MKREDHTNNELLLNFDGLFHGEYIEEMLWLLFDFIFEDGVSFRSLFSLCKHTNRKAFQYFIYHHKKICAGMKTTLSRLRTPFLNSLRQHRELTRSEMIREVETGATDLVQSFLDECHPEENDNLLNRKAIEGLEKRVTVAKRTLTEARKTFKNDRRMIKLLNCFEKDLASLPVFLHAMQERSIFRRITKRELVLFFVASTDSLCRSLEDPSAPL